MIAAFGPFLALRYLLTRRINLLCIGGVMFAVWAMLLVDSVFTGFVSQIRTDVRNSTTDLMLTDLPHDSVYEPLRAALERDDDVVATAPRLRHDGLVQPLRRPRGLDRPQESAQLDFDHTRFGFALLLGVDPAREEQVGGLRQWLVRGPEEFAVRGVQGLEPSPVLDEPDPGRRARLLLPDEVEWAARRRAGLPVERQRGLFRASWPGALFGWQRLRRTGGMREGEPLDLLCASFRGSGAAATLHTHSLRVAYAGCFATGHRTFDETTVVVPIEALRTLLGHDAADPQSLELVTDVAIRLRRGLSAGEVAAAARRLQAAAQAALPSGSGPCAVLDWEQQNEVFLSAVAREQVMMHFVLFVVMVLAAFVIYATLHMMVVQKVRDIGILAAVGGAPAGIGAVFLLGGVAVGAIGTLLGVAAGVLSARWLNPVNDWVYARWQIELFPRRLFDLREVPCRLEPAWVLAVAVGAMVLAVAVALVPSRRAARLHPVQALSHE